MSEESHDREPSEITEKTKFPLSLVLSVVGAGLFCGSALLAAQARFTTVERDASESKAQLAELKSQITSLESSRNESGTDVALLKAEMVHIRETLENIERGVADLQHNPRAVPR